MGCVKLDPLTGLKKKEFKLGQAARSSWLMTSTINCQVLTKTFFSQSLVP